MIQRSTEDASVNFIEEALKGFLESRFVQKDPSYFICYLSSQSGCNKGCKFCHLTATKQTQFRDVTYVEYLSQAIKVLEHYTSLPEQKATYMHYNFMARGEALANRHLLTHGDEILFELGRLVEKTIPSLAVRFNISTIMPKSLENGALGPLGLQDIFKFIHPTIYYSLYSVNPEFRQKWMPQAMRVHSALELLREYQALSKKTIKIHHCFIEGENDSEAEVKALLAILHRSGLDLEFNLVRYNPYSEAQGRESSPDVLARNFVLMENSGVFKNMKVIPRVGHDVHASCGMFVAK